MIRKHIGLALVLFIAVTTSASAAKVIPLTFEQAGKSYKGDLVLPSHPHGPLPLVVVVHEWWGKTDYPEMRGQQVADELGYAALVVDLYGEGKTASDPKGAQDLATPFYQNPQTGVALLKQFVSQAPSAAKKAGATLDMNRLGAIGYCFGGTQVLNLARADNLPRGENLLGVVSFHGGLASSLKARKPIHPKLLVLHGAADKLVDEKQVAEFKKEMKDDKADLTFIAYPGAVHAFTNPKATEIGKKYGIPVAYDAKADSDSWNRMKDFFKTLFGR